MLRGARSFKLPLLLILPCMIAGGAAASAQLFFQEGFEDTLVKSRGWYDNTRVALSTVEHRPGGRSSIEFRFPKGAAKPTAGTALRRKIPESGSVYLSYWVKYSANWEGSNRPYHPHEFHVVTNIDDKDYLGPSYTHLTLYIEQNEGRPLLAIQDGENIDRTRVGEDLTGITERRAVAGCNGDADGHGDGECYASNGIHYNAKKWTADRVYFGDLPGPFHKGDWHHVEAYFRLNGIENGRGLRDGVIRYWFDGVPVIDHRDVVLRTGEHPAMKFNQIIIAPYIGDGSPVDQTMWVDDMSVGAERPADSASSAPGGGEPAPRHLAVDPNPATGRVTLRYLLPRKEPLVITLVDIKGGPIRTLFEGIGEKGEGTIDARLEDLPAGIYFCTMSGGGGTAAIPLVLIR